jgi:ABC-type methionine transport system ATPase subunit
MRLVYPPNLLRVPVINQLIRSYDLTVNILQAHIGQDEAWMDVQLNGDSTVLEAALAWLQSMDVTIETLHGEH